MIILIWYFSNAVACGWSRPSVAKKLLRTNRSPTRASVNINHKLSVLISQFTWVLGYLKSNFNSIFNHVLNRHNPFPQPIPVCVCKFRWCLWPHPEQCECLRLHDTLTNLTLLHRPSVAEKLLGSLGINLSIKKKIKKQQQHSKNIC